LQKKEIIFILPPITHTKDKLHHPQHASSTPRNYKNPAKTNKQLLTPHPLVNKPLK